MDEALIRKLTEFMAARLNRELQDSSLSGEQEESEKILAILAIDDSEEFLRQAVEYLSQFEEM